MSSQMIAKLAFKDWQLFKWYMFSYALLGMIAAGMMTIPTPMGYYIGVVVLITVLIGASAHLAIVSLVVEKKEYQLSFIMGLPLDVTDYALSKLVGGLMIYLVPWLMVVGFTVLVITFSHIPDGLIPFLLIGALEILTATSILLCVGVLFGHEAATIITMVVLNLFFNVFLFWVGNMPSITEHIQSDTAVFNQTAVTFIVAEVAIILFTVVLTTYVKSRKACFL